MPSINPRRPLIWVVLALSFCAAVMAARATLLRGHGLNTEYFVGDQPAGVPALTIVSTSVSTREMVAAWNGSLPALFHAKWSGYLNVTRPGRYTLATNSDDGSFVMVDGARVVDNSGAHGAETRTGAIDLSKGPHLVEIEYAQEGGAAAMQWLWAGQGSPLSSVPRGALSTQPLSDRRMLVERRVDQLFPFALVLLGSSALWAAFVYARGAMPRAVTPASVSQSPAPVRHSAQGWRFPGWWIVFAGLMLTVASVPAYRQPWSETLVLHQAGSGLFVTGPVTHLDTPYVSFARIRFAGDPPSRFDSKLHVVLIAGDEPVLSVDDVNARALTKLDAGPAPNASGGVYQALLPAAIQFSPSRVMRVALPIDSAMATAMGQSGLEAADLTIGYDGQSPAVSVIHYWWPWIGAFLAAAIVFLASPLGRRLPIIGIDLLAMPRTHLPLLALLLVAAAIRFVLAMRGGQYLDMDELRYGEGTIRIFDLLSTGNVASAFHALLDSPDHPGFRIVGLAPAFFHVVGAWSTGRPLADVRHPSGEGIAAFALSLAAVCSVGLTYLVARRADAPRDEAGLAAFLMFSSTSMLIYTRQFFPYDAAMALLLFTLWLGLKSGDHPARSYGAGVLAGFGFLTYEGYWLMAGAVGLMHILKRPLAIGTVFWRGVLFIGGAVTLPALLVLSGLLAGQPFLQATMDFSSRVVHGDFTEGWSLPWKYLWDVEGGFLCIYLGGIVIVVIDALRRRDLASRRGLMWLLPAAAIYTGLVIGSNVLRHFVVYDRLTRQMLPFMTQQFPREIASDAIRRFGADNIQLGTTVLHSIDESSRAFLPEELNQPVLDGRPKRYVLLNARDIWINGALPGWIPPPAGEVLLTARHPRQLRSLQYHGYTPGERLFLRNIDFSIQLIDTGDTGGR